MILLGLTIHAIPDEKQGNTFGYTKTEFNVLQKNLAIMNKILSNPDRIKSDKDSNLFERLCYLRSSKLTFDNFVEYLDILQIENRDIIVRKAIIESGWFKSYLTTKYNNIFGMCTPTSRETTAIGEAFERTVDYDSINEKPACSITYSYAKFEHWTDSVDDLLLWQEYWESRGFDLSNYYEFLHNLGYAYEGGYILILKSVDINKYYPDYV